MVGCDVLGGREGLCTVEAYVSWEGGKDVSRLSDEEDKFSSCDLNRLDWKEKWELDTR